MDILKTVGYFFLSVCFFMAAVKAMQGGKSTSLPRQITHEKFNTGFRSQMNGAFYLVIAVGFLIAAVFS